MLSRKEYLKQYRISNRIRLLEYTQNYRRNHPWLSSFYNAQNRCHNPKQYGYKYYGGKGIKFKLTRFEVKQLWIRDKAIQMHCPSIDRIDNTKDYVFNNCRFIEQKINSGKSRAKSIQQFTLNNKLIKVWKSQKDIERYFGWSRDTMRQVLKKKITIYKNFYWAKV